MTSDKIISIQSRLVYGYVGSNVAELAIQMEGIDTIVLPTVLLAAHSGHQPMYGTAISKELFDELVKGVKAIDVIDSTACIVSGYIRSREIVDSVQNLVADIKAVYPDKTYICDPVMGDVDTGLYIPSDVAECMISDLLPLADILTPNHFELEYITQSKISTIEEFMQVIESTPALNGKIVIATSCNLEGRSDNSIETVVYDKGVVIRIESQNVELNTVGTGDIFTAIFSAQLTKGKAIEEAVKIASSTVSNILSYMQANNLKEMNARCLLEAKLYKL